MTAFSSYDTTDSSITTMRSNAETMLASLSEKDVRSKTSDVGDDWVVVAISPLMPRAQNITHNYVDIYIN